MRTITIQKEVYKYNELPKDTQEKIINNYIEFLLDCDGWEEDSFINKAIVKADEMQTPWFVGSYVWEYGEAQVLNDVSEVEYFFDGSVYNDNY